MYLSVSSKGIPVVIVETEVGAGDDGIGSQCVRYPSILGGRIDSHYYKIN